MNTFFTDSPVINFLYIASKVVAIVVIVAHKNGLI